MNINIKDAINKGFITQEQWDVFKLYDKEYTVKEIADRLNISQAAVKNRIKRLRNKYPSAFITHKPLMLRYSPDLDDGQIVRKF